MVNSNLVKLKDVCDTTSGGTPSRDVADYYSGNIPWVKSGELLDGWITDTEEKITKAGLANSSAKLFPAGTLLIALYGATVGRLGILGLDAATNQAVCGITPNDQLDRDFLFYYLLTQREKLIGSRTGGAQPNISQEIIRELKIPLPPLAEQKRIASLLARADRLRQLRRAANALADSLLQSVFLEMFGEPQVNDKKWDVESIGDCVKPTKQVNPKSLGSSEFWYVDITSIDRERKIIVEPKLLKVEEAPSRARKHIVFNDVLVSTVRPNLNAVAKIPQYLNNQIASTGFCVLRPNIKKLNTEYLFAIVQSKYFVEHLVKNEAGANYPAVSDGIILDTPIPLPPLALQEEFARVVSRVEGLRARMAESARQAEGLFQNLLALSFTEGLAESFDGGR